MTADSVQPSDAQPPPETVRQRLRFLGPGIIITGSIVGSGELIMTTKLGSEAGFTLLWLVILGCMIKVFVQIELGRYAMSSGETTLEALNRVPGPRLVASWLVWMWLAMFVALFFQVSGIAGSLGEIFAERLEGTSKTMWIVVVTLTVIALLVWGRYRLVERLSTAMVFLFTVYTILAVVLLNWTDSPLHAADIRHGLSFGLTKNDGQLVDFTTAFAAFGITGVGASELIYYPYWCLEKGYARRVGPREATAEWETRAKGWIRVLYLDAWISLVVYTVATVAFYLLGAAVLHGQTEVTDLELIKTLSKMYEGAFGTTGYDLFLLGAFFVLYSTYFVATASNARVFADGLSVFRLLRYRTPRARMATVKIACVLLPTASVLIFLAVGKPVSLVMVGAVAQACMLPLLAVAALYLRYRRTDSRIRPGRPWTLLLWVSFVSMAAIGVYELVEKLVQLVEKLGAADSPPI